MARLAGYLRVSHVGGRKNLRSPDEQKGEIGRWAEPNRHRVDYLDPELDGKSDDASRRIFREAVDGVKAGRWDGVVVAYLSRAGRDLRLMLDLWDEIEKAGGVFYSARENIDASTPSGKLQRNIRASIDQHELEERRDGFERAAKAAVEAGIWQRRQTPRGYVRDPHTRRLVIEDAGAEEVRDAAGAFLSATKIVDLAVRLGMTPGGVRALLRNRVYLGELKVRGHVNPNAHPPILDIAVFESVQEKLGAGARPPRGGEPSLLAGIVRCRSCGYVMTRSGTAGKRNYRCPKFHSQAVCPQPSSISSRRADEFVEAVALRELRNLRGRASATDRVKTEELRLSAAEAELSAYLQAVDAAGIGSSDAAAGMRARRESVDAAREALSGELARIPRLPDIRIGDELWTTLGVPEQSDLLRSLFAAVIIAPAEGRYRPVTDRIRIFRFGADIGLPGGRRRSGSGNVLLPWPDLDDPRLISVAGIEDAL